MVKNKRKVSEDLNCVTHQIVTLSEMDDTSFFVEHFVYKGHYDQSLYLYIKYGLILILIVMKKVLCYSITMIQIEQRQVQALPNARYFPSFIKSFPYW